MQNKSIKLIRITTISLSLETLLKGQLSFLNNHFDILGVAGGKELLEVVSQREGIRTTEIIIKREISPWHDLCSLYRLIRLFKKEKPAIVHANTPKASLLAMLAAFITRVPHRIYTVTGLRFETTTGYLRRLLIGMERLTCACATKVIPEGDGVKHTLQQERITSKPLQKILNGNINGVDLHYFNKTAAIKARVNALNLLSDTFTFVFVGRMVRDKGIHELVKAFVQLYNKNKKVRLLLVGPMETKLDPVDADVQQQITSHPHILWTGFQPDVRPYLAAANALVFASYREGFPNVVLQAGAMGLPCIVTNINGCNEIIKEGVNGVIVPAKNKEALYQAMNKFIKEPAFVETLAKQSRPAIESRFEQTKVWEATLTMYQSLII